MKDCDQNPEPLKTFDYTYEWSCHELKTGAFSTLRFETEGPALDYAYGLCETVGPYSFRIQIYKGNKKAGKYHTNFR